MCCGSTMFILQSFCSITLVTSMIRDNNNVDLFAVVILKY